MHLLACLGTNGKDEPTLGFGQVQLIGSLILTDHLEGITFQQIKNGNAALMLGVRARCAQGLIVDIDADEPIIAHPSVP